MLTLSLDHGVDAPVRQAGYSFGETTYPDVPSATVRVARKLNAPQRVRGDQGGWAYTQDGLLYSPRPGHPHYNGFDIGDGDKVTLPEGEFIVRARPENDHVNPLDGHDFGVRRHRIESV